MHSLIQSILNSFRMLVIFTLLTGIIYPLSFTSAVNYIFPKQSNGSLIKEHNKIVGSELIGQQFFSKKYFHSRPSYAGEGYNATKSGASNLGPTNVMLKNTILKRIKQFRQENPELRRELVPTDLILSSASGLDAHILPSTAFAQVIRIAQERHIDEKVIKKLIQNNIEKRQFGVLGVDRINVLKLNIKLDKLR